MIFVWVLSVEDDFGFFEPFFGGGFIGPYPGHTATNSDAHRQSLFCVSSTWGIFWNPRLDQTLCLCAVCSTHNLYIRQNIRDVLLYFEMVRYSHRREVCQWSCLHVCMSGAGLHYAFVVVLGNKAFQMVPQVGRLREHSVRVFQNFQDVSS